jgi:hypothetical protein
MSLKSVPTFFLVAAGLTVVLLKRKSEKKQAVVPIRNVQLTYEEPAPRSRLVTVVHPQSALSVAQPYSKKVDYTNLPVAGIDQIETGIALNLGETAQTQFLRALGYPIGTGGVLIFPFVQGPRPPANQVTGLGGMAVTLPNGKTIVPRFNLADPFEGRTYFTLDGRILPPDVRGPLQSKEGDEYSLAYFRDVSGNLVDAFGRRYPPGDYDWSTPWLSQLAHNLENGIDYAIEGLGKAYQELETFRQVFGAFTNSPIWQNLQTGFAYIPGWGSAVSAGMAMAASYGRGESLADMGLAAARGAIPSAAQPAFDVAVAIARGSDLDDAAITALRDQYIPAEYRNTFDRGIQEARKVV